MTTTRAFPQRAPSTTPLLLRRMRAAMVALTLFTGAVAGLVTFQEHAIVSSAGQHTAVAAMQVYAAHQALADADDQAAQTIPLGSGLAGQYQDDIAAAEQNLEQVAENNTAGTDGTRALQLIEGLLPAYTGLIEQADAHYRLPGSGEHGVGAEDLWEASDLMHGQILTDTQSTQKDSVTDLQSAEQATLARQESSPWASPWLSALWLLPAAVLLLTLAATQRLLYRRSRRMLSKYLTMAAAAVVALCVVAGHVIVSEDSFRMASGPLATVVALQKIQAAGADRHVQNELAHLLGRACDQCQAMYEAKTVAAPDIKALGKVPAQPCPPPKAAGCITDEQGTYTIHVDAARAGYGTSLVLIAVLTVVLLLLIPLGLWRYLDEYRYREA